MGDKGNCTKFKMYRFYFFKRFAPPLNFATHFKEGVPSKVVKRCVT